MMIEVPDITTKINKKLQKHFHVRAVKKQKFKFYVIYKFIIGFELSCLSNQKA